MASTLAHEHRHRNPHSILPEDARSGSPLIRPTGWEISPLALHDRTTSGTLWRRVGVLSFQHGTPYRRHHVVPRAITVRNYAIGTDRLVLQCNQRRKATPCLIDSPHLLAACDTGIRSLSKSSRSRLFSSVKRRNFRSAMDCLFFLICDGSPTSLDVYAGMMTGDDE